MKGFVHCPNSIEASKAGVELTNLTLEMRMTISRRKFCGALAAGLAVANANSVADDSKPKPLRVIAYNIYKCTGWPHD